MTVQFKAKNGSLLLTTIISFCLVAFFFLLPYIYKVHAAINNQINFQGKLVNSDGTNVTTGKTVIFTIYDAPSDGTALWTETDAVTVNDGIFRTTLGDGTTLPGSIDFNSDNIYLGIKVSTEVSEMTPRIRFAAVPYAFNAAKVAGLTVTDTTGTLTIPNGKTIQFADAFTTSGAFALTLTTTNTTDVILPTTGTLSTLAGSEELTNKTIGSTGLIFSGATTDITTTSGEALVVTPNGAATLTLGTTGTGNTTSITLATDSTGDAEVVLPDNSIGTAEINDAADTPGDEECLTYELTGAVFEWQNCSSGSGISTVRESDLSPSVGSLTTLEFGPASTSEDEFVVTDQTGGVARVVLGSKAVKTDASQTLTNKTIGTTGLVFSGATTDIDTAAAEGLVIQGRAASTIQTTSGNITLQPAGTGTTGNVQIGAGGAGSTTPDLLVLDVKSDAEGALAGTNGAMYYNASTNKFRCYQNGAWTDCIGGSVGGGVPKESHVIFFAAPTAISF